jgi:hypothetical protein
MYLQNIEKIIDIYTHQEITHTDTDTEIINIGREIYKLNGITSLLSAYNLLLEICNEREYSTISTFIHRVENNWKLICNEF